MSRVVEVVLPNGSMAFVRATDLDGGIAEKVGWVDRFNLDEITPTLEGIATTLRASVEKVRPSKVTVAFGIELVVKSGKLSGLLVEGQGGGSLTVTIEWEGEHRADA
jgi:hypothetical protein